MDWAIQEDRFDPDQIAHLGNKYLIGNGYMGVRGALAEYTKEQLAAVNLSGIYDQAGEGWREPLNAPNGVYIMRIHGTFVNFLDLSPAIQEDIIKRLDPGSTAMC